MNVFTLLLLTLGFVNSVQAQNILSTVQTLQKRFPGTLSRDVYNSAIFIESLGHDIGYALPQPSSLKGNAILFRVLDELTFMPALSHSSQTFFLKHGTEVQYRIQFCTTIDNERKVCNDPRDYSSITEQDGRYRIRFYDLLVP